MIPKKEVTRKEDLQKLPEAKRKPLVVNGLIMRNQE